MARRTHFTRAVVLRTVAYGDSDRIATLLTESDGKIGVLARGARKSQKRFGGALEPFAIIEAEIALGRGDLGRLASARLLRAFPRILADLDRMSVAGAGLEILREAVQPQEPDPRLLAAAEGLLEAVDRGPATEALRLAFQVRVLALVGLLPSWDRCVHCGKVARPGKAARFDPAVGSVVCTACGGGPFVLGGHLRAHLTNAGTAAWAEIDEWSPEEVALARTVLDRFLTRHLGRPLKGGSFAAQVRELDRAPAGTQEPER